jgi:hypothetical protein
LASSYSPPCARVSTRSSDPSIGSSWGRFETSLNIDTPAAFGIDYDVRRIAFIVFTQMDDALRQANG